MCLLLKVSVDRPPVNVQFYVISAPKAMLIPLTNNFHLSFRQQPIFFPNKSKTKQKQIHDDKNYDDTFVD